jgi:alkanesulfonate monooxygenase SsuD/methylene tetrahydromethanopterin reductase-like flavin-dependent oxidoreductase (luciferase family)
MNYGVSLPNFDAHWHPRTLARLAQEAEQAGWDGFFIWDHILFDPYGGLEMSDPWVALAAIAMSTSRVRIGALVTPIARRRPWKVAREAISIDHLSDGRLILGVGLGAPPREEFEWLGESSDNRVRAARLDEGLEIITGLWSGEKYGFSGTHYQIKETIFLPRPVQTPRVPIWVAATYPNRPPMRRAARWDGLFPIHDSAEMTPAMLAEMVAYTRAHRASDAPFDVVVAGKTPGEDPAAGTVIVSEFAAAGLTWWLEDCAMWRFKPWEPWNEPYVWPVDEIETRIRQGPPRA